MGKAAYIARNREINAFCQSKGKYYIDYTGVCGIGKTTLLRDLLGRHAEDKDCHFIYIDFGQFDKQHLTILIILQYIVTKIYEELPESDRNPFYAFKKGCEALDTPSEEAVVDDFNDGLNEFLKYNMVLLCLDTTEVICKHAVWERLEKKVLQQHFKQTNLTVITAHPKATFWKTRAFKSKRREIPLSYLDIEQTRRQVEILCMEHAIGFEDQQQVAEKMHDLTMGHALSNDILTEVLADGYKRTLTIQTVEKELNESIIQLACELIGKCISEHSGKYFSEYSKADEDTEQNQTRILEMLAILALPRRITLDLAIFLLKQFLPEIYSEKEPAFFARFLDGFEKTHILEWDGYLLKMTPVIKNILQKHLQRQDRQLTDNVPKTIIDYYHNMNKNVPHQSMEHLQELLYHKALMYKADINLNQRIQGELRDRLKNVFKPKAYSQWYALRNSLLRDKELIDLGVDINALVNVIEQLMEGVQSHDRDL